MRADSGASLAKRKTVVGHHAYAVMKSGQLVEAEALFREALALDEQIYGAGHLKTLVSLNNVGYVVSQQKRFDEAAKVLEQVVAVRREKLEPGHTSIAFSTLSLASMYLKGGHHELALRRFDEGLRIYREAGQPDYIDALRGSYNRARTLLAMGRYEDAYAGWPAVFEKLLATGSYRAGGANPLRLLDAELHRRLAIDDRACRVRADLVEPAAEDLAKLAELEANCAD
jgi:tetratricopeptide (TPR) repeat protein